MKNLFLAFLVIGLFSSCSLFKKVTRQVNKSDSTSTTNSNVVDKSLITVKEIVDTTVKPKADTGKVNISLNDLINPFTHQPNFIDTTLKDKNTSVNIKYNKKTKSFDLTAIDQPNDITIKINKTTVKQNDIQTNTKTKTEVKKKEVLKVSNPTFTPTQIAIGIGSLILFIALIWFVWNRIISKVKIPL